MCPHLMETFVKLCSVLWEFHCDILWFYDTSLNLVSECEITVCGKTGPT